MAVCDPLKLDVPVQVDGSGFIFLGDGTPTKPRPRLVDDAGPLSDFLIELDAFKDGLAETVWQVQVGAARTPSFLVLVSTVPGVDISGVFEELVVRLTSSELVFDRVYRFFVQGRDPDNVPVGGTFCYHHTSAAGFDLGGLYFSPEEDLQAWREADDSFFASLHTQPVGDDVRGCDVHHATGFVYYGSIEPGNNSFIGRVLADDSASAEEDLVNVTNGQGAPIDHIKIAQAANIIFITKTAHLVKVPITALPLVQESLRVPLNLGNDFDNGQVITIDEARSRFFYGLESGANFRIMSADFNGNGSVEEVSAATLGSSEPIDMEYHPVNKLLYLLLKNGDYISLVPNVDGGGAKVVIVADGAWDALDGFGQIRANFWSFLRINQTINKAYAFMGTTATQKRLYKFDVADGANQEVLINAADNIIEEVTSFALGATPPPP